MSSPTKGRYQGRFTARETRSARRITGGVLALVILLLCFVRIGAEAFKLLSYADVFIGGGRMLIYGKVDQVDIPDSLSGKEQTLPIYTQVPDSAPENYVVRLNDGKTILYNGHSYELNRDLTTVLFLGIDHTIQDTEIIGTGGQSDAIFLLGIDTKTGKTTVLNISRETYSQVDVYSVSGIFVETKFEQITLAYSYGDGKHTSAENAVRSVSRLLFGLPISSYVALDFNGIKAVNEAVGGVSLESMVDMNLLDKTHIQQGQWIELHGDILEQYLRYRGGGVESNSPRMERMKQYITEFSKLAIRKSRDNLSFPVELFSALAPYMVTNLEISDVTFLSSAFLSHGASFTLRDIDGSYDMLGENAVYYPDEVDLFEAVLEFFYTQVD